MQFVGVKIIACIACGWCCKINENEDQRMQSDFVVECSLYLTPPGRASLH